MNVECPGVHRAFGHSPTTLPLPSSATAGKYSWIGYALLGCHWLGWLMRPAHVDEPPTAGCQPTNRAREPPGEGRSGAGQAGAKVEWVSAKAIAVHRPLHTHKHKHTQFQACCHLLHFLLNEWGATWEGAINKATSFPGLSASCSKWIIPVRLPPPLLSPQSPHLPNIYSLLFSLFTPHSAFHYFSFYLISSPVCS